MHKDKLDQLGEEFKARNYPYFIKEAGQSINVYEKADQKEITISSINKFMVIPTQGMLSNPFLVACQSEDGIITVTWPNGVICQTDDYHDVLNIFFNDKIYLHHIYEDSEFPFFFLKVGMLFSPELYNTIREDPKLNIYDYTLTQLKNDLHKQKIGLASSRAHDYAVRAAFLREYPQSDPEARDKILKTSALELEFEAIRKEKYNWSPSRISGFYLVSDTFEGQTSLKNMFYKPGIRESLIVKLKTIGLMSMIKVDYRWVEAYTETNDPDYIINYWESKPFVSGSETWEYLYEGALEPIDPEQIAYFKIRPTKIF
ncbi:hypothetical protein DBR43_17130 [Pedobacter sp. KBW06]|uniref:hypothetical protein n=1 Tax=Pedobacter sp. KBW06 TaxID=2153359 RepID=UPI000F5B419C|nr:hypothetical protein [Pedobacter sp. KBW06]RQO69782.1 hypothetical protein DBR43_17130 [Pedobacter sp. KBW06]